MISSLRIAAGITLWPLLFVIYGILGNIFAAYLGCSVSSAGPEPCMFRGRDIGEWINQFCALGYGIAFALFWMIPTGLIWLVIEAVVARKASNLKIKEDGK